VAKDESRTYVSGRTAWLKVKQKDWTERRRPVAAAVTDTTLRAAAEAVSGGENVAKSSLATRT
jgi:hypothetical protein